MKRCVVGIRRPGYPEPPSGKNTPTVWFPSMATMAAVLSEDNQVLLHLIRDKRPKSLTALAELTGRQVPNLSCSLPLQFEEFAQATAWWNNREEGPQAWKVDFAAKRAAAVEAATPHWQRAEAEHNAAIALGKLIRELEQAIQAAANGQKAEWQERLKALKSEQSAREQAAKSAQAEGDTLYWPIFNLDVKNPNAKAGLEHADPKDLIASMRSHEAEVMRLLGEIEALVAEVQA